jgi:hypothetical protein
MSLQIIVDNELRVFRIQEAKQIIEIMTMFMGFLLPCIFPNAKGTNQDLEVVFCRSPISTMHVQGFHNRWTCVYGTILVV